MTRTTQQPQRQQHTRNTTMRRGSSPSSSTQQNRSRPPQRHASSRPITQQNRYSTSSSRRRTQQSAYSKQRRRTTTPRRNYSSRAQTRTITPRAHDDRLKVYPLGGNEEVGRNCTVFEWGNDIIILDLGFQFPEEDMPGVDYIIPNIESLKGKEKNIRGVVLSHGHLDHIGAVPYILPEIGNPTIIGSDMTLALVKKRWDEFKFTTKLNTISIKKSGDEIQLGKFKIHFFSVAHSVLEAFGIVIQTPYVNIVHMGDWRYDLDPVQGPPTNFSHLAKWNTKHVPSLLAFECIGSTKEGHQESERTVYKTTEKIIQNAPGRIIVGTFSSMLERVGQLIKIAENFGRKVAIDGMSMKGAVEIGKQFGFIKAKPTTFVDIKEINSLPPKKVMVVATGSQADERSVLVRVASREHRHIRVQPDDTIIFSSSVIPGNERVIQRLKDSLYRQGANVVHKEISEAIHGGGHAYRDDMRLLLKQVRPHYVMPVYANHYMLREAEKLTINEGWKAKEVFVLDNGQIIEFSKRGVKLTNERVPVDNVFVDGLGVGDVSNIVLRDRKMLADDGMVVVIATIRRRDGKLVQNPDIISRGFIYLKENKELVEAIRRKVRGVVMKNYDARTPAQEMFIKNKVRNDIGQFIFTKTQRRPMVLPVIIEV